MPRRWPETIAAPGRYFTICSIVRLVRVYVNGGPRKWDRRLRRCGAHPPVRYFVVLGPPRLDPRGPVHKRGGRSKIPHQPHPRPRKLARKTTKQPKKKENR